MNYNRDTATVMIDAAYLASFAVRKNASPAAQSGGFKSVFCDSSDAVKDSDEYSSSVVTCDNINISITHSADSIYASGNGPTVELLSYVKTLPAGFNVSYNYELLAKAVVSAFVCVKSDAASVGNVRLTFVSKHSGERVSFERSYTADQLYKMTYSLIERALPFIKIGIERETLGQDEIKALTFPYGNIRDGQHDLMLGIMKTVRRGGKLIVSAPTGTGKTMATLFPSIKAIGSGYVHKIFYLTAKSVTGKAAFDAMKLLAESAPHLRTIMISSKERGCAEEHKHESCFACPRMNETTIGGESVPYETRRHMALCEILGNHYMYDSKLVGEYAEKYNLCPYELSLDISEYCDTVICDYNYAFDAKVRFKRYFTYDRGEKYVFLIDECHNLPDRVRASYSAKVDDNTTAEISSLLRDGVVINTELGQALNEYNDALNSVRVECLENATVVSNKQGDHRIGFNRSSKPPSYLVRTCATLGKLCRSISRSDSVNGQAFERASDTLSMLASVSTIENEGSIFLSQTYDDSISCSVICLDPSEIIRQMTETAHATVMFSATLNPTEYFSDMLGCSDAPVIRAESPFDPGNLCVAVFDGVSTRLSDRRSTATDIAEVIAQVLDARPGHYFVFFPSYQYMKMVSRELLSISPGLTAVMQKQNMSYAEREKFLRVFKSKKYESVAGLCVLGGVFSEGVDLAGESLIGVIVVGAGLPGISSELNLMSEYFENKYGSGHLYAYEYPAINRIEQAAGRVIRTAEDRGVVVLVDDRMSSPEIAGRFPDFWPQVVCTSDTDTLARILERFWKN